MDGRVLRGACDPAISSGRVSHPAPAAFMRHRGPALLVETIETRDPERLGCISSGSGEWSWPRMLEGAAQTAGLLTGTQPGGPISAVVAQYRDVVVRVATHRGRLRFTAHLDRRILHFWRCRVEVTDQQGAILLEARVTLAPDGER